MAGKFIALLTLSVWAVASPLLPRDPSAEAQDIPVVIVTSTLTVPRWSKTDTVTQLLNCTQTNYISVGSAPADPTSTATHSAAPLLGRQTSPNPPAITPSPPPPTTSPVRTITSTTWIYEPSTQSGDLTLTDSFCGTTVDYAYTVEATVTQTWTLSIFPKDHTITSTTTISCNHISAPQPTYRSFWSVSSDSPSPPAPTELSSVPGGKDGHAAAVIDVVDASWSSSALPTPTAPLTTLHLTHTEYPLTSVTATGYTTAWLWTCSPMSAEPTSTST